ncbi:hypothetical protein COU57_02935 [Candidatus Pacearchaeota archaeon CG10_big_fil_rev_8_21_14_0_10_32_14]|nr:MAG: hypothetical protein COU57_02935 [Candidatus Pacearchaeota archaeon CG10_big_fil_rev_8_21_14_0_10_32_14]
MDYTTKKIFGWAFILIVSFFPVYLWVVYGPGIEDLTSYAEITHSLGELFGLVGMTMFALTFVLSTRIKFIEDIFGGLDKVYIVHGILGGMALIFILFHPIFLVLKFIPQEINRAAEYLLPSSYWSVNFGIISIIGMIILIFITLFTKMKYNRWKFTHEFLGLMFALAVLHIFLIRGTISQDNIFEGYYLYATAVSIIGLGAFSYSLFIKDRMMKNAVYKISSLNQSKDLFEINMVPDHKPINYSAGQFLFLRFYNENLSKEAHPFSIASKSNSKELKVIIKKLGDFTNKLEHLKVGDKVFVEGPYGRFNFKNYKCKNQVWIAAGIGITPFLGMVEELLDHREYSVDMIFSAKDDTDFVGYNLLNDIASANKNFKFIPWNSSVKGHVEIKDIYDLAGKFREKEFFLCGPENFKQEIIEKLKKAGVKEKNIHEEAFDFV